MEINLLDFISDISTRHKINGDSSGLTALLVNGYSRRLEHIVNAEGFLRQCREVSLINIKCGIQTCAPEIRCENLLSRNLIFGQTDVTLLYSGRVFPAFPCLCIKRSKHSVKRGIGRGKYHSHLKSTVT